MNVMFKPAFLVVIALMASISAALAAPRCNQGEDPGFSGYREIVVVDALTVWSSRDREASPICRFYRDDPIFFRRGECFDRWCPVSVTNAGGGRGFFTLTIDTTIPSPLRPPVNPNPDCCCCRR